MRLVLILSCNFIFFILVKDSLDSYLIALILFAISCLFIRCKNIDYQFFNLIKRAKTHRNLEELLKEKKYHFSKQNTELIKNYQKLVTNNDNFKRFINIQQKKYQELFKNQKKEALFYGASNLVALIPLISLEIIRKTNIYYYYHLYSNRYIYVFLITIITLINIIYNCIIFSQKKMKNEQFYDNYSLCFHINCSKILNIEDERLTYNESGFINDINIINKTQLSPKYLFSIVTLVLGSVGVLLFI